MNLPSHEVLGIKITSAGFQFAGLALSADEVMELESIWRRATALAKLLPSGGGGGRQQLGAALLCVLEHAGARLLQERYGAFLHADRWADDTAIMSVVLMAIKDGVARAPKVTVCTPDPSPTTKETSASLGTPQLDVPNAAAQCPSKPGTPIAADTPITASPAKPADTSSGSKDLTAEEEPSGAAEVADEGDVVVARSDALPMTTTDEAPETVNGLQNKETEMAGKSKFDDAFKRKVVAAVEKRGERTIDDIAADFDIAKSAIYRWREELGSAETAKSGAKVAVKATKATTPKPVAEPTPARKAPPQARTARPVPAKDDAMLALTVAFDASATVLSAIEPMSQAQRARVLRAVEALASLAPPMRAKVVEWVRERLAPAADEPSDEHLPTANGIAREHWQ